MQKKVTKKSCSCPGPCKVCKPAKKKVTVRKAVKKVVAKKKPVKKVAKKTRQESVNHKEEYLWNAKILNTEKFERR